MQKLIIVTIAASLCLPLRADDGPISEVEPAIVRADGPCPGLWDGGGETPSFGLGDSALGSAGARPVKSPRPLRRFSLCPGLAPASGPETPGAGGHAPAPLTAASRDLRAPVSGVRNASAPFHTKFWRGMLIITGTEIASGLVLSLMPKQNTNWNEDAFSRASSNFSRAWTTPPTWDSDGAFHDWFGHPYAGAFYYNMIRSQGGTIGQSFAFSVLQSFLWEYVLEAWAEQPSIQDLVSTPLIGAVVGELFHRWSVAILRKGDLNFGQKALVFFLNPSWVINNGYRPPE